MHPFRAPLADTAVRAARSNAQLLLLARCWLWGGTRALIHTTAAPQSLPPSAASDQGPPTAHGHVPTRCCAPSASTNTRASKHPNASPPSPSLMPLKGGTELLSVVASGAVKWGSALAVWSQGSAVLPVPAGPCHSHQSPRVATAMGKSVPERAAIHWCSELFLRVNTHTKKAYSQSPIAFFSKR